MGPEIVLAAVAAANASYLIPLVASLSAATVGVVSGVFIGRRTKVGSQDAFDQIRFTREAAEAQVRKNASDFAEKITGEIEMVVLQAQKSGIQRDEVLQDFIHEVDTLHQSSMLFTQVTDDLKVQANASKEQVAVLSSALTQLKDDFLLLNNQLKATQEALVLKEIALSDALSSRTKNQPLLDGILLEDIAQITNPIEYREAVLAAFTSQQRLMSERIQELEATLIDVMAVCQELVQQNKAQREELIALRGGHGISQNSEDHEVTAHDFRLFK